MNKLLVFILEASLLICVLVQGMANAEAPVASSHLADSTTPETHTLAHYTPLSGPNLPSRTLREDEVTWKSLGPINGFVPLYSSPYPDGQRVIWVGGYDRISKLDADTLDVLTTHAIGGTAFHTEEENNRHIAKMDSMSMMDMLSYRFDLMQEAYYQLQTFYRMVSVENEYYIPYHNKDGSISLRAYGEADSSDPASAISLRREWKIPPSKIKSELFGLTMTSDGMIVVVMSDGRLFVVSKDFQTEYVLNMPRSKQERKETGTDIFDSFFRNSAAVDEHGGIYVVTRDYMHRVQWTGKKLSLDKKDGAWTATYPNPLGVGSGTTPALMGWGDHEDHLVIIGDGTKGNNAMALWRDEIPADWKGIDGYDRRVAGMTKVKFGVSDDEQPQVENSIVVNGYGAFIDNFDTRPTGFPEGWTYTKKVLAGSFVTNNKDFEPKGGTMIKWNPEKRVLETAWMTDANFAMSICTVSAANDTLYCWGAREGNWTLEGVDWNTGESKFHYVLDNSQRYNPFGGTISVAPNGAIDCGCHGGLGIVRIMPSDEIEQ